MRTVKRRKTTGNNLALHKEIAGMIIEEIENGNIVLGEKLPSQSELIKKYNVSVGTVRQALSVLEKEGLIRTINGKGSFISLQSKSSYKREVLRNVGLVAEITGHAEDRPAEDEIFRVFLNECKGASLRLIAGHTDFDSHKGGRALIQTFSGISIDGLCVFIRTSKDIAARVEPLREEFGSVVALLPSANPYNLSIDSIDVNIEAGVRQMVNYLLAIGHRQIALVGPSIKKGLYEKGKLGNRWFAVREELEKAGIGLDESLCVETSTQNEVFDDYKEATISLVKGKKPATAIFAANDWMARNVMATLWNQGILVPNDVSIVGLDNIFAAHLVPQLTTIAFPFEKMAKEGIRLLCDRLSNPNMPVQRITLNSEFIVGQSTKAV